MQGRTWRAAALVALMATWLAGCIESPDAGSDAAALPASVDVLAPPDVLPGATVAFATTAGPAQAGWRYAWDFGDGSTSTLPAPTHVYPRGSYAVQVVLSNDRGQVASQRRLLQVLPPVSTLIATRFVDAQHGYAQGLGGVVLATQDGGLTWDKRPVPPPFDGILLAMVDGDSGWAYEVTVEGRRVYRTDDGCRSWTQVNSAGLAIGSTWAIDASTLVLAGADGMVVTEDAGLSWRASSYRPQFIAGRRVLYGLTIDRTDNSQLLSLSTDLGRSVQIVARLPAKGTPWMFDPGTYPVLTRVVQAWRDFAPTFRLDELSFQRSVDGGRTWQDEAMAGLPGGVRLNILGGFGGPAAWVFATGSDGRSLPYRTLDGGRSWTLRPLPAGLDGRDYELQTLPDSDVLVAAAGRLAPGAVGASDTWITIDGGASWQKLKPPADPGVGIQIQALGFSRLLLSFGRQVVAPGCPRPPSGLSNPCEPGYIAERWYVSRDGGASWTRIPTSPAS